MPSTLREVGDYLWEAYEMEIIPAKRNTFKSWIDHLVIDSSIAGQRLACCIALETDRLLVNKSDYAAIFNAMDFVSGNHPVTAFEYAIRNDVTNLHFTSVCGGKPDTEECQFATAMKIRTFRKYYYNQDRRQANQVSPDDVAWHNGNFTMFCRPFKHAGGSYRREKWVFHHEQWSTVCPADRHPYHRTAGELANFLGLVGYEDHELVCLLYPSEFNEPTYQPCAANRDWGNEHLFISYIRFDNFGRTRNRSGNRVDVPLMREQIHLAIDENQYEYQVFYLGKVNVQPVVWDGLLDECLNRFTI